MNIIFDWSGTLNDEINTSYQANMLVFRRFGIPEIPFERYKEEFELPYMNWYRRYFPDANREEVHAAYIEALDHVPKPACFPWANGLLMELHARGTRMAILSALDPGTLNQLIKEHEMGDFFVRIMGGVHDKRDAVHQLLRDCSFDAANTVFIGDMIHDIDAGKAASLRTIAVSWGYDSREKLERAKPDRIVDTIIQLKEALSL